MSKKLAIRGHSTRGKEVIELLEMIGGKNCYNFSGFDGYAYYVIGGPHNEIRAGEYIFGDEDMYFFTLEEFLEKYPFKVGDKAVYIDDNDIVVISEIMWDDTVEDIFYNVKRIDEEDCFLCPPEVLKPYKETNMNENKFGTVNELPTFEPMFKMNDEIEYKIPDGYEITEVSKDKVFIKPIKPKYPKTYKECCDVLGLNTMDNDAKGYKADLIIRFQELLIALDAYWKIAGEEMGLGKPWEPEWNWREYKFCIGTIYDEIEKFHAGNQNCMLAFPTEEMRDTFYENFKDLIEGCKELL